MRNAHRFARAVRRVPSVVLVPTILLASLGAACVSAPPDAIVDTTDVTPTAPVVVYLVRHAETTPPPYDSNPPNPELSESGQRRAEALAQTLRSESIDTVFSTDYNRTQQTAAPVAADQGLEVTSYDPRALHAFADRLRGMPGRHVVVGHSNTTPMAVEALGGDPGEPIDDTWEYDRLYIVTIEGGSVSTVLLRYGRPSTPH